MRRLVLISTAALALSLAVFAAWSFNGGGHKTEAVSLPPISCVVSFPSAGMEEATCTGHIVIITPFGVKKIDFVLVVDAVDNAPPGPSKGDVLQACTIALNGNAPKPIHVGPCP